MFRLFWKIFLGFWLTSLLLVNFAIVINQQLNKNITSEIAGLNATEIANRTAFILRRLPAEASEWQTKLKQEKISLYIKTEDSKSLSDAAAPNPITRIFSALQETDSYEKQGLTRTQIGRRLLSIESQTVSFVLDIPRLSLFRLQDLAGHLTLQFVIAMVISGMACWILARYLTRNLEKISTAARRLAAGNLNTRIELEPSFSQDEIDRLSNDFNHMAEALETSMNNQRRLVRDISHELRSPLTRLQLALELGRNSESHEQFDRIEQEADRLNDMIGQLLAMPDERLPLEDCIDLGTLVRDIADQCEIEADQKNLQFVFSLPQKETLVMANATQLHSAIENIIRNGIRYSQEDQKIEIHLTTQQPHGFKLPNNHTSDHDYYFLLVRDRGPGIPEEDLEHIFKPFYRVDQARNRKTGGYGIGLAIVNQVTKAHGGEIQARNWQSGLEMLMALPQHADE